MHAPVPSPSRMWRSNNGASFKSLSVELVAALGGKMRGEQEIVNGWTETTGEKRHCSGDEKKPSSTIGTCIAARTEDYAGHGTDFEAADLREDLKRIFRIGTYVLQAAFYRADFSSSVRYVDAGSTTRHRSRSSAGKLAHESLWRCWPSRSPSRRH